jgi:hypothetical protein
LRAVLLVVQLNLQPEDNLQAVGAALRQLCEVFS